MKSELSYYLLLADAVIITDINHRILDVNSRYEEITGYDRDMIIGLRAGVLKSGHTPRATYDHMKAELKAGRPWSGVLINRKRDKSLWHSNLTITPIVLDDVTYYVGIFRDLDQIPVGMYVSESRIYRIQNEILKVLALSCEIRDPDIESHLIRVQNLTSKFLQAYNRYAEIPLPEEYIQQVVNASIMHDIGKSGIPEGILYKPGPLTYYERVIIETHPLIGVDILDKISSELDDELFLQEVSIAKSIIEYHHEKWDGTGYPHKLKGDDIPFEAQIVSLVDVYDALTSRRSYKDTWSQEQAIAYLKQQKGISFRPDLVDIFIRMISE